MHAAPPFDQSPIPYVGTVHRAYVYRVVDGDTLHVQCDVGFGLAFANPEKGVRLVGPKAKGFNTPELNSPDPAVRIRAQVAADRVAELVRNGYVYVESWPPHADDKYGRWLMGIYVPYNLSVLVDRSDASDLFMVNGVECFNLASQLVAEGLGEWRDFG
jgi:endonuclease YncB( thermonuclease family)